MATLLRMTRAEREVLLARLEQLLQERTDVLFATVHGSFLDGEAFRDLDVAVWRSDGAPATMDLTLATCLSRDLRVPVDVRCINNAPLPFQYHALRGRVVAVRDESLLAGLMERVAREYHDIEPVLRRSTKEAFAR